MSAKITAAEFARRRVRLMHMMNEGDIAVLPGARLRRRNRDIDYPFRQDSDFFYLTGFTEPDALLVLVPGRQHGESILFCQERNETSERWEGEILGPERATATLGLDDAFPIADLADILPGLLEGRQRIYATLGEYPKFDERLLGWVHDIRAREAGGAITPGEFVALKHLLHELRLFKSAGELRLMREAARISCAAHERAMSVCEPGMTEAQLEAELVYEFMRQGARYPAYGSIVGSGPNACVMHYMRNDRKLRKNDLVLIDAGGEYQHYAADVTRTFPVSGQFKPAQQAIYEVVLAANMAGISACRAGASFSAPHEAAVAVMVQGLVDLKLLNGDVSELLETQDLLRFCPHKTSHWLGIDVHDVGDYRIDDTWRQLEPGMVLTVEPGLYLSSLAANGLPARYRDIGVRIEDDVLITKTKPEILTNSAPKSVRAIEKIVGRSVKTKRTRVNSRVARGG